MRSIIDGAIDAQIIDHRSSMEAESLAQLGAKLEELRPRSRGVQSWGRLPPSLKLWRTTVALAKVVSRLGGRRGELAESVAVALQQILRAATLATTSGSGTGKNVRYARRKIHSL
jgi:hypothetical protein